VPRESPMLAATKEMEKDDITTLWQKAEQGDAEAQYQLGMRYERDDGVDQNRTQAFVWFRKAELQKHKDATASAENYRRRDLTDYYKKKLEESRQKAEQGDIDEQYALGLSLSNGTGLPRNTEEGLKWLRKAAEQGHAEAQYHIGLSYRLGEGVAQSDAEAIKWIRKAAEQGHKDAIEAVQKYNTFVEQKNTTISQSKNNTEPLTGTNLRQKAEQGNVIAQYSLGNEYYMRGVLNGNARDYAEAVKWYKKAAEQGHADAQYFLGDSYAKGEGIPKNETEAIKWFQKAAEQGHKDASQKLSP